MLAFQLLGNEKPSAHLYTKETLWKLKNVIRRTGSLKHLVSFQKYRDCMPPHSNFSILSVDHVTRSPFSFHVLTTSKVTLYRMMPTYFFS